MLSHYSKTNAFILFQNKCFHIIPEQMLFCISELSSFCAPWTARNEINHLRAALLRRSNIRLTGTSVPAGLGAVVAKQEP